MIDLFDGNERPVVGDFNEDGFGSIAVCLDENLAVRFGTDGLQCILQKIEHNTCDQILVGMNDEVFGLYIYIYGCGCGWHLMQGELLHALRKLLYVEE